MNVLIEHYTPLVRKLEGDVFERFGKFYHADINFMEVWMETDFCTNVGKSNVNATVVRQKGNSFFAQKDFVISFKLYTKSLCFAVYLSEEYGLALANRSAVLFALKDFKECVHDIEVCFKTKYPNRLRPKIFLRKAECWLNLNKADAFQQCLSEMNAFLNAEDIPDKEKFILKGQQLSTLPKKETYVEKNYDFLLDIPKVTDGENRRLANASNKIKMSYNDETGRHIVASTDIKRGDVLFVEKALAFAPIFQTMNEISLVRCYHCLKYTTCCVPCQECTLCTYCDEKCRDMSWQEVHQWECWGMQTNFWFHLGIALPAFKSMVKGAVSGFATVNSSIKDDLQCFGDKKDNYKFFSRLYYKLPRNEKTESFLILAGAVVFYLKKYTDFFTWLRKQPNIPKKSEKDMINFIGGTITEHIAKHILNSTLIQHWDLSTGLFLPTVAIPVACGIFPSVSIMNHACKPNVATYFICDTMIVKAAEDINCDGEILNCYGVDYRNMSKHRRAEMCETVYMFKCKCCICSDSRREMDLLDSYVCTKCNGMLPENRNPSRSVSKCMDCGETQDLTLLRSLSRQTRRYLDRIDQEVPKCFELLTRCLTLQRRVLYRYHKNFEEIFCKLYIVYVNKGDPFNMLKYFNLWLEVDKVRRGENSRAVGINQYQAVLDILNCLQTTPPKRGTDLNPLLNKIEKMLTEATQILSLYYQSSLTSGLTSELPVISNQ